MAVTSAYPPGSGRRGALGRRLTPGEPGPSWSLDGIGYEITEGQWAGNITTVALNEQVNTDRKVRVRIGTRLGSPIPRKISKGLRRDLRKPL
jgi:hypothetical protein